MSDDRRIEIEIAADPYKTRVTLDGKPLRVLELRIQAEPRHPTRVEIAFIPDDGLVVRRIRGILTVTEEEDEGL